MDAVEPRSAGPRRRRTLRTAVLVALAVALVSVGAAAAAVVAAGSVAVHVDGSTGTGDDVHVVLPAALLDLALAVAPDHVFSEVRRDLGDAGTKVSGDALRALAEAVRDLPDAVLVEVRDASTHVVVEKRDGAFRIRVSEPDGAVRVDVPVRIAVRLLERVAEA